MGARSHSAGRVVSLALVALPLALALLLVQVAPSAACSCEQSSPEQLLAKADAAFTGTITESVPLPDKPPRALYTVAVEGIAKGTVEPEAQVLAGAEGNVCATVLRVGERWMVFATLERDVLEATMCSGSTLLTGGEPPPVPVAPVDPARAGGSESHTRTVLGVFGAVAAVGIVAGLMLVAFRGLQKDSR